MRVEDLTVEVRNKALERLGQIPPQYLNLPKCTSRDSAVGEWALTIPADHALAEALRTPGSGIIITLAGGDVFLSGPMTKATTDSTFADAAGVLTVEGISDEIVLWDALAWPDPDLPIDEQGDYDLWLGDLSLDPLGALGAFLPNLDRLPLGSLGYGMTLGGLMAPPVALFFDDFNRADSTTVGNDWIRYRDDLGGGIISGALGVVDDMYDSFERAIALPAAWRISWTIASMAPAWDNTWFGLDLYATYVGGTVATVGVGEGTYYGAPKSVWIGADGTAGVYELVDFPVVGDVVSITLDASGTLSAAINGTTVASLPSSGVPAIGYIGLQVSGTGTGTSTTVDNFTIMSI